MTAQNFHATCVAFPQFGHTGVLLTGTPGSGKSGLAMQLMERGAKLVSDDQTILHPSPQGLIATAPEGLRGLIEITGYGIVQLPDAALLPSAILGLYVALVPTEQVIERMPEQLTHQVLSVPMRHVTLSAHDPAAAAKIFAILSYRLLDYTDA